MNAESPVLADPDVDVLRAVEAASDANLRVCLQCGKCTCGCPVSARSDLKPHELVRLLQIGERDEVLGSRLIWDCTSCETCVTRCPQNVDIPAMIDTLRQLSRAEEKVTAATAVPVFNDIFLRTVRRLGRMYEAGLLASFKLRTLRFFDDLGKFPMMLWKRKIALWPRFVRGGAERKRLFQRVEAQGKN